MTSHTKADKKMAERAVVKEDRKWEAEDALRTLTRAEEIRRDSSLMKEVERCRDEKLRDLAAIKVETAGRTIKKVGK